uniref:Hexosyltransferase n=1 Tax=Pyrodinium bahamense TaxID=73915 RepID=A0A7S0FYJ6_9DINO|mmetsp:Transcript_8294/g.23032  ORF Transcript_8294/g.23032 Transcript_8294/m.23032 type:complete len:565 (+) Transcript_8294:58-1752(+)
MSGLRAVVLMPVGMASLQLLLKAAATDPSSPVFGPCSGQWSDCLTSRCCSDSAFQCFEKNHNFAQCRPSCSVGIHYDDPPKYQSWWTCRIKSPLGLEASSQVSHSMAVACKTPGSWPPTPEQLEAFEVRADSGSSDADWLQGQNVSEHTRLKVRALDTKGLRETAAEGTTTAASRPSDTNGGGEDSIIDVPEWAPEAGSQGMQQAPEPAQQEEKQVAQRLAGPSLFCFAVVAPGTSEPEMVAMQYLQGSGIFGCDGYRVVSNVSAEMLFSKASLHLPDDISAHLPFDRIPVSVVNISIWVKLQQSPPFWDPATNAWKQGDKHLANAPVFVEAWDKIFSGGEYSKYDWTVKLDVDAFPVPQRIRAMLRDHTKHPSWNMYMQNTAADRYGNFLHGPIEVLSKAAMDAYSDGAGRCKREVYFRDKGEDWYLSLCLQRLGIPGIRELRLLDDAYTVASTHVNCDTSYATFHPLKDLDNWNRCLRQVCPSATNPWTPQAMYSPGVPEAVRVGAQRWLALVGVAAVSLAGSLVASCRARKPLMARAGCTEASVSSDWEPCLERADSAAFD